jgi:hypothetical protein
MLCILISKRHVIILHGDFPSIKSTVYQVVQEGGSAISPWRTEVTKSGDLYGVEQKLEHPFGSIILVREQI